MEANIDVSGAGGASHPMQLPDFIFRQVFDAPIALVFKAWTDPVQVAAWWGPHGYLNLFAAIEPYAGGRFHVHMQAPDGSIQPMSGYFEEIEAPHRIVFVTTLSGEDGSIVIENIHTVTLVDRGARTEMTMHSRMLCAAPSILSHVGGVEEGWSQSLERLGAILKAI